MTLRQRIELLMARWIARYYARRNFSIMVNAGVNIPGSGCRVVLGTPSVLQDVEVYPDPDDVSAIGYWRGL